VTPDDVVFSLRRVQNLKGPFSYLLNGVTVEAGQGNTVVLSTEATNVALPFLVSYPNMGIVNAALVRAAGGTDAENAAEVDTAESLFEERSLGTGPYVIERFSLTGQVELVRNESYWGAPAPFDRIVMVESESQTQLLNVQSGRTDIALDLSSEQISALDPSGLQVLTDIGPIVWYMFLNLDPAASSATANADLREAVRYALDYDALGELFGDGATRACGMVPSMVLGALAASDCIDQDLDRARAALARSGIQNPSIRLEYIADFATDGISHGTVSERVQRQLGAVGITVELNSSPLATQLDRYRSGEMPAHMFTISMRHPDVSSYVVALSDGGGNARPAGLNRAALPEAQDLVDRILTASTDAEREPLVREWQRVLNERGPFIPMFQSTRTLVAADDLGGVESHPLYIVDLRNVSRG
jgi:peptide/nickel transport system substrate-binding protein